ncbi:MAG: thioredoxin family protein [Myxococcales bacterium]|nr:thioredoxin family protein [Myxococcales bacterium]
MSATRPCAHPYDARLALVSAVACSVMAYGAAASGAVGCGAASAQVAEPLEADDPAFQALSTGGGGRGGADIEGASLPPVAWLGKLEIAKARAAREGRNILVWVHADWMAQSAELDRSVWAEPRVRRGLQTLVPLKLDLTNAAGISEFVMARYAIKQLPTVLLLDAREREVARLDTRITAERMLALIAANEQPQ